MIKYLTNLIVDKTAQILADRFYDSKIFEESIRNKGLITYDDRIHHKVIELIDAKSKQRIETVEKGLERRMEEAITRTDLPK